MSKYKKMMLVVTASCHDDFNTQIRLESPDFYDASASDDSEELLINPLQEVADYFENKGVTIDQGGDDNTIEFDLPDSFDNVSTAYRTANKVMKKLQVKLKKYIIVPEPYVPPAPVSAAKLCCKKMTKEEYSQYFKELLDSGGITQQYYDVCMSPENIEPHCGE